jgi:hypothetical protein
VFAPRHGAENVDNERSKPRKHPARAGYSPTTVATIATSM